MIRNTCKTQTYTIKKVIRVTKMSFKTRNLTIKWSLCEEWLADLHPTTRLKYTSALVVGASDVCCLLETADRGTPEGWSFALQTKETEKLKVSQDHTYSNSLGVPDIVVNNSLINHKDNQQIQMNEETAFIWHKLTVFNPLTSVEPNSFRCWWG